MTDTPDSPDAAAAGSPISTADVAKVAKLARLELTDDELERFTHQLADILDHARDIEALELGDVEPMARPLPLANVFRSDEPHEALDREEVLAAAPAVEAHQFRVPPSLGDES
jgi:aspartyl-tRNA(Asn)/glutamyl-tRNA(Gln) amidotransferase subunit C